MKKLICLLAAAGLAACTPTTTATAPVSALPGAATVCALINVDKLDVAWRGYDVAIDAVNLLIDHKVIVPGSVRALAVADANDKVLAAFQMAEHARSLCEETNYLSAMEDAKNALVDLRAALRRK